MKNTTKALILLAIGLVLQNAGFVTIPLHLPQYLNLILTIASIPFFIAAIILFFRKKRQTTPIAPPIESKNL